MRETQASILNFFCCIHVLALILSGFLLKYVLYDDGSLFGNILLIFITYRMRIYFIKTPYDYRDQEVAAVILQVLFDTDLINRNNVQLLIGIICIRELFKKDSMNHIMLKEITTFVCGLICLCTGWYNVGKMIVIQSPALFCFYSFCSTGAGGLLHRAIVEDSERARHTETSVVRSFSWKSRLSISWSRR